MGTYERDRSEPIDVATRYLLETACTELGFCNLGRVWTAGKTFNSAADFASLAFAAEGLTSTKKLQSQLEGLYRRHFPG